MEQFKEKVKALRERRGWSQEDLAREIDVSLSTIQRWEKKDSKPTRLARRELKRLFKEAGLKALNNEDCRSAWNPTRDHQNGTGNKGTGKKKG